MNPILSDISSQEFVESLQHALINRIWVGLLIVVLVSLPFSVMLYMDMGWTVAHAFHGLLVLLSAVMVLGKHMLTLHFKSTILGLSCLTVGVFGLSEFGLLATEWSYTVLGIIVVGMAISGRAAALMLLVAIAVMAAFMWAYTRGELVFTIDAAQYHAQYGPWFLSIFASMLLPAFVLRQFRANQRALHDLLGEVERQRDVIAEQVYYDELTGLPSRRLVLDRLDMALKRLQRIEGLSALLFLDLDGFKAANDMHGHAAGDEVLRVVGQRMCQALRGDDTVARYGGDEFLIILNLIGSRHHAGMVAQRLIDLIEEPIEFEGASIHISASVGIETFSGEGELTREMLIVFADEAMYRAKADGKGRYAFFHADSADKEVYHGQESA